MNYFEFFGLDVSFYPAIETITKKYRDIVKNSHPDVNEGSHDAENLSAQNNIAFKTLKNDRKRIAYVLALNEVELEGKGATLPPVFLMEMMELNEELSELPAENIAELLKKVKERNTVIWNNIEEIGKSADTGAMQINEACQEIKALYLQSNYMLRIIDNHGVEES